MNAVVGKHLVLAGAGHAHMVTLQNIDRICRLGHKVTVIGPDEYHYYSGMGPGLLGGTYTEKEIRFASRKIVEQRGGRFVRDAVACINPEKRVVSLQSGSELSYDILSCNFGSFVPKRFVSSENCPVFSVKPIRNLAEAGSYIRDVGRWKKIHIGIIGGGASSAELAGNVLQLAANAELDKPRVTVFCRSSFLGRSSERVRSYCRSYLNQAGVVIIENTAVSVVENGVISTVRGDRMPVDLVFAAHGIQPSPVFQNSGIAVGANGGLLVNEYLQAVEHPFIFGGGDCIYFSPQPLSSVGVYAVRQNPVLYRNLCAALQGERLQAFHPGGGYLLILNLGNGIGVLEKGKVFWHGRLAFILKDFIDRRFMKKYSLRPL